MIGFRAMKCGSRRAPVSISFQRMGEAIAGLSTLRWCFQPRRLNPSSPVSGDGDAGSPSLGSPLSPLLLDRVYPILRWLDPGFDTGIF